MKRTIQFSGIALLLAIQSCRQGAEVETKPHNDLDAFIESKMKELHVPALSYAVMQNGEYISSGVYGLAEVELNVPADEHTLFNVGSVGKTFTATAILLLEEEGKLSIKDPVGKHLEGIPESWDNITIEHLLNHTAGIKDYCEDHPGYTLLPDIDRAVELTPEQYIEMCTTNPLNFPTGTRFAYSNSNYALLGFIIRKHIDTSMDEFMRKRIFEPAGMMDTRYESAFALRPNRAKGYHVDSTRIINGSVISDFYSTLGDMGILTTGKDLAKWGSALVNGNVVSKSQVDKMWTIHQLNDGKKSIEDFGIYGLGWRIDDVLGSPELGHNGGFKKGYIAIYRYYPEYDLSIAVMMNRWIGGSVSDFDEALAERFLPEEIKLTGRQPITGASADSWLEKIRTFGEILAENGDLTPIADRAYIDVLKEVGEQSKIDIGNLLTASKFELLLERDLSQNNTLKHGKNVQKVGLFLAEIPVMAADSNGYLSVYLSEEGKIVGIGFKALIKE